MIQEREEKPFLKGGTAMIHGKKKRNSAGVAPSDNQEKAYGICLYLEAA